VALAVVDAVVLVTTATAPSLRALPSLLRMVLAAQLERGGAPRVLSVMLNQLRTGEDSAVVAAALVERCGRSLRLFSIPFDAGLERAALDGGLPSLPVSLHDVLGPAGHDARGAS
jgi:MinD-like ATPase involved in chromosome partitioning or flagellar assembly